MKEVKVEVINGEKVIRGEYVDNAVDNFWNLQIYTLKCEAAPCWK